MNDNGKGQEFELKLMDAFEEKMMEVYANRDYYSRGKIIDLAKENLKMVLKENRDDN